MHRQPQQTARHKAAAAGAPDGPTEMTDAKWDVDLRRYVVPEAQQQTHKKSENHKAQAHSTRGLTGTYIGIAACRIIVGAFNC